MKKNIFIALITIRSLFIWAQVPPPSVFVTAGYNLTSGANTQYGNSIIAGSGGYNAGASAQAIVEGVSYVGAVPGYKAAGFTGSGYACLRINANLPRIASFHPNGFASIPQYDRFEIGVNIPAVLQNQVDAFIQTGVHGSNHINPYDPDSIRVECTYNLISVPATTYLRHAFYKVHNISVAGSGATSAVWNTASTTPEYPFRIRFAPPVIGQWKGTVKVYVNNALSYTSDDFTFTVSSSVNPGHLSMANTPWNKIYKMKYSSGRIFYGLGSNVAYAEFDQAHVGSPNPNGPNCPTLPYVPYLETKARPYTHQQVREVIHDLSKNGANFIRVRLDRVSVPIEETPICDISINPPFNPSLKSLTNFSANEKYMWEMDSTLRTCEKDSVKIMLTLLGEGDFRVLHDTDRNNGAGGTWGRNPYSKLVTSRDDFFTDATAKHFFQKRLYYIEARWGYSTSIAAWEMINKTENLAGSDTLTHSTWNLISAGKIAPWLCDMRTYLQSGNIYPQHPVTNGGALPPWEPLAMNWNMPNNYCLDFYTDHSYIQEMTGNPAIFHPACETVQDIEYYYSNYWIYYGFSQAHNKPHLMGEFGVPPEIIQVERFSQLTFHDEIWGSLVANSMSNALPFHYWLVNSNDGGPTPGSPGYINPFHTQFKPAKAFVNRINFNTLLISDRNANPNWRLINYSTKYPYTETDDSLVKTYWMRTGGRDTVYGWTKNESANFMVDGYTAPLAALGSDTSFKHGMNYINHYVGVPKPPSTFIPASKKKTVVQGLLPSTNYDVKIYDTWSPGGAMITGLYVMTDANGMLRFGLDMPYNVPIVNTSPLTFPDYAFIATKGDAGGNPTGRISASQEASDKNLGTIEEGIYPMPASDKIFLKLDKSSWINAKAYVISELGVKWERPVQADQHMYIGDLPNGFYTLKLKDEQHEKIFKLIIER